MALRGVLFDLGGTLLDYNPEGKKWEDTERIGALGMYKRLLEYKHVLPPETEALDKAWTYSFALWNNLDTYDVKYLRLGYQLSKVAEQWGVQNLSNDLMDSIAKAYMDAVRSHVRPMPGAAETLRAVREQGLKIGLISNTIWPGQAHREDMEQHGLIAYFDHTIFSSDVDAWKPHHEVFELGMKSLALAPDEVIFVGDSLYFDIWGAQQAGIRAVWIEQHQPWLPAGLKAEPNATIKRLPDLLPLLDRWRSDDERPA